MAAEGPPSTPSADTSTARRGWPACAGHDAEGAPSPCLNLPAVCCSSSRPRAPSRESGGGRDLRWRQRSWTFGRSCEGKEDPYVYRDRDFGAERIRALSHIACGGCLLGITSRLCIGQR